MSVSDLKDLAKHTTPAITPGPDIDAATLAQQIVRVGRQVLAFRTEALRMLRPLPHVEEFFSCEKQIRLLFGSNQSAKTFHGLAEVARAVTGQDPFGKYPKNNGRA
ncbi:unnamed protein product, partial [marine sediment metagenome]